MEGSLINSCECIYLDFDGVTVNTIKAIVDLYNEDFRYYKNNSHVNWWEVNTWDFTECSCATKDQINTYFNQPRFFNILETMPWANEVIKELSKLYKIKVVSLGYSPNLIGKMIYLTKRFPYIEFIPVNMKFYSDKAHIDMSDGIFIDDSSKNLATSNAKYKMVFGDVYPWNSDWEGERLHNWIEVKERLLR